MPFWGEDGKGSSLVRRLIHPDKACIGFLERHRRRWRKPPFRGETPSGPRIGLHWSVLVLPWHCVGTGRVLHWHRMGIALVPHSRCIGARLGTVYPQLSCTSALDGPPLVQHRHFIHHLRSSIHSLSGPAVFLLHAHCNGDRHRNLGFRQRTPRIHTAFSRFA